MKAADISAALDGRKLEVLRHLFPAGWVRGHEFVVGDIFGHEGESLKVSLNGKGPVWADFNGGEDRGGDLLDLWAAARCGGDIAAAMEDAKAWLGIDAGNPKAKSSVARPDTHPKLGRPDATYDYTDAAGNVLHYVYRWNATGARRKEFRPLRFADGRWQWSAVPPPRPLYGLADLAARPAASVLICEGEKAAQGARDHAPDRVCMSWSGGVASVGVADFRPLRGRRCVLWPDHDAEGINAMQRVARLLADAGAAAVAIVSPPSDLPPKWDLGDPLPEGWTEADIMRLIAEARQVHAAAADDTLPPDPRNFTVRHWLERDLAAPDFLLGDLFSTTSRVMLVGGTGAGKTNAAMACNFAMAEGRDFLHWRSRRPARLLYLDGEMSARLARERLRQAVQRHGYTPDNLILVSRDDFPDMPPLDAPEGQQFIDRLIAQIGGVDIVTFDNVQALIGGDMKDEEGWAAVLPWVRDLTRRSIGQWWLHHTGHDTTRSYGTKTREWQLDTVMLMKARDEQGRALIDFDLEFPKARERTPQNRSDFATAHIWIGDDDQWHSTIEPAGSKQTKVAKLTERDRAALDCLHDALARDGKTTAGKHIPPGIPTVTVETWRAALKQRGLYDGTIGKSRQWFYDMKTKLIAAGRIGIDGDFIWAIGKEP